MMRATVNRVILCLMLLGLLALPSMAMSGGPPAETDNDGIDGNGDLTVRYGCTCHNNGAPSDRSVVMITGVPVMYGLDETYQYTITVADSLSLSGGDGNNKAGFLLSSAGMGAFTWADGQDIREAEKAPGDVSHSAIDSDGIWFLNWTAPTEDVGAVSFWLAGNSVDGSGVPDEGDYWNLLSFTVNAPGTIDSGDDAATLETRTISVGDYDTLFLIEESDAEKEAERQAALSLRIYEQGNLLYWTSLVALIVGAVVQKEILERRYDEAPEFLATELAYPQAIRSGLIGVAAFAVGVRWMASDASISFPPDSIVEEGTRTFDLTSFAIGCAFFISAWAAYSVYRTVLAARAEPQIKDTL